MICAYEAIKQTMFSIGRYAIRLRADLRRVLNVFNNNMSLKSSQHLLEA